MRIAILLPAVLLAGCATTGGVGGPAEVVRYHLDAPLERGTVVVQPAEGGDGLSGQPYAAAVSRALGEAGYIPAAPGGEVQFVALVEVRHRDAPGRGRRSGVSIGIGLGGFSGGRSGGVGYGGGVSVPVGATRGRGPNDTELSVTIKRRVDQSPVWEGHARTVAGRSTPDGEIAEKLAHALFTGFPGESGRSIEVR